MIPTIDLHGKTQNEAIDYLEKQLAIYKLKGEITVVVITGRGWGSKKGVDKGALKLNVPQWLKGPKFKSIVNRVETSDNPGAYCVWLKQPIAKYPDYLKLVD